MNENKLVELLKEISRVTGSEFKSSSNNVPLVHSTIYSVDNENLSLNVKISKAADVSALNKNITLDFQFSNQQFENFIIKRDKSLLGFLTPKVKFKVSGNENQEIVDFLIDKLKNENLSGVRLLEIKCQENVLRVRFKSTYLDSLKSMLTILLGMIKSYQ